MALQKKNICPEMRSRIFPGFKGASADMLDQKAMTLWNDAEKWSHSHPGCFTRKVKLAMLTVHVSVLASWSRDGFFIPSHTGH